MYFFPLLASFLLQTGNVLIMWDHEIKAMASTHALIAASVFLATVIPVMFVPGFSVYGTHMLWIYSVSGSVSAVSVAVFWLLGVSPPTKKHTLGYKVKIPINATFKATLSQLFMSTFENSMSGTFLLTFKCQKYNLRKFPL